MKEGVQIRLGNKEPLVVGNRVFRSSNDWDLTENELEKARIELGETEDKKQRCLQELKNRLSKEGNYRLDDEFLLRFLRVRKYDCKEAYAKVKKYYDSFKKRPDFAGATSNMHSLKNYKFFIRLPFTDEEGRIIFWSDVGTWKPQEVSFAENLNSVAAVCQIDTMNPKCQINGIIGIWDCEKLSARQVAEFLRKNQFLTMCSMAVFAVPWRMNKLIIINSGRLVLLLWKIISPMFSKKLRERVFLLGDSHKDLHQLVNPAILPKELGGTLKDGLWKDPKFMITENIPYLEYDRSFTGD